MAYDQELAGRVRRWFAKQRVTAQEKPMMGGLCFMVDDKMCLGVESDRLMVRLDPGGRTRRSNPERLHRPNPARGTFALLQGAVPAGGGVKAGKMEANLAELEPRVIPHDGVD